MRTRPEMFYLKPALYEILSKEEMNDMHKHTLGFVEQDLDWIANFTKYDFSRIYCADVLLTKKRMSVIRKTFEITDNVFNKIDDFKAALLGAIDTDLEIDLLLVDPSQMLILDEAVGVVGYISINDHDCLVKINVSSNEKTTKVLMDGLEHLFSGDLVPTGIRLSKAQYGIRETVVRLTDHLRPTSYKEVYPYLDFTPAELWNSFKSSKSNVVFMYGAPGTGKSSFIRAMLAERGWDKPVYLADESGLLSSSSLIEKIRDFKPGSVIVTEDCDLLIGKREDGNSVMSSLLNALSGIASVDVKLIVTTNLSSLRDVDTALLRPGRTFKTIEFKELGPHEVNPARMAYGKTPLAGLDKKRYSLAEIFNYEERPEGSDGVRTVGFI